LYFPREVRRILQEKEGANLENKAGRRALAHDEWHESRHSPTWVRKEGDKDGDSFFRVEKRKREESSYEDGGRANMFGIVSSTKMQRF